MNKIFRVIWSHATQSWVAVSELTKAHKKAGKAKKLAIKSIVAAVGLGGVAMNVSAIEITGATLTNTQGGHIIKIGSNAGAISGGGSNNITIGQNARTGYNGQNPNAGFTSAASSAAKATNQSVAIGGGNDPNQGAWAEGDQSVAIGANVHARGDSSIAIGGDDVDNVARKQITYTGLDGKTKTDTVQNAMKALTGVDILQPQYNETVAEGAAVAIGIKARAADISVALGMQALAKNINTVAIGSGALVSLDNAIAIGGGSKADADSKGTKETSVTLGTVEYKFAGGENVLEGDIVSFGSKGYERQLKNIAAGKISNDSRDAINGSQLHSVLDNLVSHNYLKYSGDDDDSASGAASRKVVNQNLDNNKLQLKGGADVSALTDENIGVIYAAGNNIANDGSSIEAKDKANYKTGALNIKLAQNLKGLKSIALKDDNNNETSITGAGITVSAPGAANTSKVSLSPTGLNNGGNHITNVNSNLPTTNNGLPGTATTAQQAPTTGTGANEVNPSNAATVSDVLNAGWNIQGNGTAKDFVKAYDTVNFADGSGTQATVEVSDQGKTSTVKYNIKTGNGLEVDDQGNVKVKTKANDTTLTLDGDGLRVNTGNLSVAPTTNTPAGVNLGQIVINTGDAGKIATVDTVANAINSAYWTATNAGNTVNGGFVGKAGVTAVTKTVTPGTTLTFEGGDGIIVDHTTPGTFKISSNASKIEYFSVRSGETGNQANDGAKGTNSIAIGPNASVTADQVLASGTNTNSGIAIGMNAAVSGIDAYAFGKGATSTGANGISIGTNAKTVGANRGASSIAIGLDAVGGDESVGTQEASTAVGYQAGAHGDGATAIGAKTKAYVSNSLAIGIGSVAGSATKPNGPGATIGTTSNDPTYGLGAVAIGDRSVAAHGGTVAIGTIANNRQVAAYGLYSMAMGAGAQVGDSTVVPNATQSDNSMAIGYISKVGRATAATAIGPSATVNNNATYGIALGASTIGENAVGAIAIGTGAKVEGNATAANALTSRGVALGARSQVTDGIRTGFNPGAQKTTTSYVGGFANNANTATETFAEVDTRKNQYSGLTGKALKSTVAPVSIGSATESRQINHVAAGYADDDAVNVAQLRSVNLKIAGDTVGNAEIDTTSKVSKADVLLDSQTLKVVSANKTYLTTDATDNTITITPKTAKIGTGTDGNITYVDKDGKVHVPTTDGLATAQDVANAMNSLSWKVKADKNSSGSLTGTSEEKLVKAGDLVTYTAGKNISLNQTGTNFTFSTVDAPEFTNVTVKDAAGNTTAIAPDGVTITKPNAPADDAGNVTLNQNGLNNGGNNITNVKGNLPETKNGATGTATTNAAAPNTTDKNGNNYISPNNAATVGDILNAGWNIKENTTDKDFVKAYDTVSFSNGTGTTASVEVSKDGTTSTVKYSVDTTTLDTDAGNAGKVKAGDEGNKFATAKDVAGAINSAYWKAAAAGNGAENDTADNVSAGTTVTFEAGKNLKVTHTANKFKFETSDTPEFKTISLKDGDDKVVNFTPTENGLSLSKADNAPINITGVTSGLDNHTSGSANGLRDLNKTTTGTTTPVVSDNTAATVGDLRNMGWVVSSNKTTGTTAGTVTADAYNAQVKNANEVEFVGTGIAKVSGKTDGEKRVITVHVDEPKTVQSPIVYTKADGTKVVQGDDGEFYEVGTDGQPDTTKKVDKDQVIASLNNGKNSTTDKPMDLGNVRSTIGWNKDGENASGDNGKNSAITADAAKTATTSLLSKTGNDLNKVATVGDLQAVAQAGLDFNGNTLTVQGENGKDIHKALGNKLIIKGEGTDNQNNFASASGNIQVASQAGELVVKLNKELKDLKSAEFKADGKPTTKITSDGITITPAAPTDGSAQKPSVSLTENGLSNGGNNITDVKGNLEPTQNNTATAPDANNATKSQTAPTIGTADGNVNTSNAATVGDVLNAGWNLQENNNALDFVKPYDTVNFANGSNTTITSSSDGAKSTIQVNVTGLPIQYTKADGTPIVKVGDKYYEAKADGTPDLTKQVSDDDVAKATPKLVNAKPATGKTATTDPTTLGNVSSGLNKFGDTVNGAPVNGTTTANTGLINLINTEVPDSNAATVGDLRNMGWIVSSDNTTGGTGAYSAQVKNANEVKFVGTGLATVSGKTDGDVRTITVDVNAQNTTNSSVTPVEYTKADGTKVYPQTVTNPDGTTTVKFYPNPDGTGTEVPASDVITSVNGPNGTTKPATLSNVEGNLAGAKTDTTAPTTNAAAPNTTDKAGNNYVNPNNAATVGDVLNAGWNLQNNGTAKDFVRPYDTVNFVNGQGTVAIVTTDANGVSSSVTFNIDKGELTTNTDGSVKAQDMTALNKAKDEAQTAYDQAKAASDAEPTNDALKQAADTAKATLDAAEKAVNDANNKVATVQNVAEAINDSFWTATSAATANGEVSGTTEKQVKPGTTVTFEADKNIKITQAEGKFTFATKENVEFTTVKVGAPETYKDANGDKVVKVGDQFYKAADVVNGKPKDDAKPLTEDEAAKVTTDNPQVNFARKDATKATNNTDDKVPTTALDISSTDGKPTQLTGVGSVLNTKPVDTTPTGGTTKTSTNLIDLEGDTTNPINKNAAATVGDLQNMGWVVSSDKTTGATGEYKDVVKNANEVRFVGTGTAVVSGKTDGNVRTITVSVDDQVSTNNAQMPVNYTKADGTKLYPVKDDKGNVTYHTTPDGKGTGDQVVDKGNVITSINGPDGTTTPTTLSNIKSNLPETRNTDDATGPTTKPKTTAQAAPSITDKTANNYVNPNNAATVGDILNAGWNLQGNGSVVDFVKAYDTVNFVDGKGTKAVVSTDDNLVSRVTFNVDAGTITNKADGSAVGPVTDALKDDLKKAQDALTAANAGSDEDAKKAAADNVAKAQKTLDDAGNHVATAQSVADAINNSGFTLKTSADGGEKLTGTKDDGELINPGKTVEMVAGKNLTVKQDADGKVTYATKDDVAFNTVNVGAPETSYKNADGDTVVQGNDGKFYKPNELDADGKPNAGVTGLDRNQVTAEKPQISMKREDAKPASNNDKASEPSSALNISDTNGKPTQLTGVASTLNTKEIKTSPNGGTATTPANLVDLEGDTNNPVNKNAAATVGDLQNMGWVVGADGNGYVDTVKNANKVEFKGGSGISVTGETKDGVREITVAIKEGEVTNKVTITDKDGKDTNAVKIGDNYYKVDADGKPTGDALTINPTDKVTNNGAGFVTGNTVANAINESGWNVGLADKDEADKAFANNDKALSATTLEKVNPDDNVRFANGKNTTVKAATVDEVNKDGKKVTNTYVKVDVELPIGQITAVDAKGNKVVKDADGNWYPEKADGTADKDPAKVVDPTTVRQSAAMDPENKGDKYSSISNRTSDAALTQAQKDAIAKAEKDAADKVAEQLKDQPATVVKAAQDAAKAEAKDKYLKDNNLDKGTGGTVITNVAWGTQPNDAVNVDQLRNSGWNLDSKAVKDSNGKVITGNTAATKVKMDETVNIDAGNNIEITRNGRDIEIATSMDPTFNTVKLGTGDNAVNLSNKDGALNVGGAKITGVAAGDISANSSDAVNGAQIYALAGNQTNVNSQNTKYDTVKYDDQGNPTFTTVVAPQGKTVVTDKVTVIENGKETTKEVAMLKTYNVHSQKEIVTNNVLEAIYNMNEQGIKFFHSNDGVKRPKEDADNDFDSSASGKFATAIGSRSNASGENAVAIGYGSKVSGNDSISIGTGNQVKGNNSGAFGDPSIIDGNSSYSVGNNNTVATDDTFVLGNNVTSTASNSVFLGTQSGYVAAGPTTAGNGELTQQVTGGVLNQFAGGKANEVVGVVSVGVVGVDRQGQQVQQTRRIQNVAPGLLSERSTDAINGSQLYSVAKGLGDQINNVAGQVNKLGKRMEAGVAGAMAAANLMQPHRSGQSAAMAAIGQHKNQAALAVGYSRISDNGKYGIKLSLGADTQGQVSTGAGVSYFW